MYTRNDKQWVNYCKALGLNAEDKEVREDVYYIKGFREWKKLNREFYYYKCQTFAISFPKW